MLCNPINSNPKLINPLETARVAMQHPTGVKVLNPAQALVCNENLKAWGLQLVPGFKVCFRV